ncbi:Na/Pi cotransporter family protein [Desulfitibacter alkalitolerans]|uniref:Na/Pi cotransporter family protein n=1 Tax=Desulfitibacter alkalitolerans TaxID=264641 RepID=UPI0006890277|nr:Na/Pi symporter [Desulfitibacter alkalitolerans]
MVFILGFLGGLSALLLGIYFISKTLESYHEYRLKYLLKRFTETPMKGFLLGTIATMVLQSSSVITVLTIGLVNARLLTFYQAVGIVLGTNVGTTFTAQLVAFDLKNFLMPMVIAGLVLYIIPIPRVRIGGKILLSFSLVLVGLSIMTWSTLPLENSRLFSLLWSKIDSNLLYSISIGIISTAVLQSSSGVTAILLAIAPHGYLTLTTAIAVILGSNVGTCFTALLAVIHSSSAARKVALAHIILNLGGLIIFLPIISSFALFIEMTSSSLPRQIANAQTIYNLLSSLIVLPFAKQFADLTTWTYNVIPKRKGKFF